MHPKTKVKMVTSVSTPAAFPPLGETWPSSEVPLEWLKKYSSPKPLRRAATPKDKKSE